MLGVEGREVNQNHAGQPRSMGCTRATAVVADEVNPASETQETPLSQSEKGRRTNTSDEADGGSFEVHSLG